MAKFLGRVAALTKQAGQTLFPRGLSMTRLPVEAVGTADGTVPEGPRGGPYFPHRCHQHKVHIIVTLIVMNTFFLVLTM
jgi:hypothetical protein